MSDELDLEANELASVPKNEEAQAEQTAKAAATEELRQKAAAAAKAARDAKATRDEEPDDVGAAGAAFKSSVPKGDQLRFGLPPESVAAQDDSKLSLRLSAGFYIGSGSTGAGKSVTSVAFLHHLVTNGVPVGFLYLHEARATSGPLTSAKFEDRFGNTTTGVAPVSEFLRTFTAAAHADVSIWDPYQLSPWATSVASGEFTVLVIDSVTLSMRSYASNEKEGRSGEPTMEGGLQPSDIEFCMLMQAYAAKYNIMLIGLVNDDLVPFADKLEGVVEGSFHVTKAGTFMLRNRETRVKNQRSLPDASLQWSLKKFFRYKSDEATQQALDPDFVPVPGFSEVPGLTVAPNPSVYVPPSLPKQEITI